MESYALQLDDFTGEILKPPRQKARREPEWMASLTSLPSNCTRSRKGDGRETTRTEELDVSLRRMPLRLPTNRIALKDIFVTRENYKRLGFGGIKRYYALPPNAAAIRRNTDGNGVRCWGIQVRFWTRRLAVRLTCTTWCFG